MMTLEGVQYIGHLTVDFGVFIRSKNGFLNVAIFNYSWHKIREVTKHRKYGAIKIRQYLTVTRVYT